MAMPPKQEKRKETRRHLGQQGLIVCSDGSSVKGLFSDIAIDGVAVLVATDAAVGAKLLLRGQFVVGGVTHGVEAIGEVRYSIYVGNLNRYRVGFRFLEFRGNSELELTNLLTKLPII